jgi:ABC-type sugar transport system ATPase subunit
MEALEGAAPHLLEMDRVSKAFLGVPVLNHVSLSLDEGEVLGVVGENGAGKSTLMKILAGIYQSDEGTIKLGSESFAPHNPRDALNAGIIVVHQELSQFPDQTVAENIFAGGLPRTAFGTVRGGQLMRDARAVLGQVGLDIAPSTRIRSLSLAQRQLVEIGRALSRRARVIVLGRARR